MPMPYMQRRTMLLAISQLALAATLGACGNAEKTSAPAQESDLQLLASLAYDLFPYEGLKPEMYVQAGEHLLKANSAVITEGLQQVRAAVSNQPWKQVEENKRIALLTGLQSSPFFAALRAGTLEVLYRSPEVFALVGYGGSAVEQGGYINRGFADIDWLPASTQ